MSRPGSSGPVRPVSEPVLVLIVEDEEPLAELVAIIVQGAGYTPLVALHGQQALELARTQLPALLITDLMLPHLDGAGLIAALRAEAAARGTSAPPVILMTAASLVQARAAGADVVLRKPFHLRDLEALLLRFLGSPPSPVVGMEPTAGARASGKEHHDHTPGPTRG